MDAIAGISARPLRDGSSAAYSGFERVTFRNLVSVRNAVREVVNRAGSWAACLKVHGLFLYRHRTSGIRMADHWSDRRRGTGGLTASTSPRATRFFFEDVPGQHKTGDTAPSPAFVSDFVATSVGLAFIRAFTRLPNAKLRRRIVALVEGVADDQ